MKKRLCPSRVRAFRFAPLFVSLALAALPRLVVFRVAAATLEPGETYLPHTVGTDQPVRFSPAIVLSVGKWDPTGVQSRYEDWVDAGLWDWIDTSRKHKVVLYHEGLQFHELYTDPNVRPADPTDPNDPGYAFDKLDQLLQIDAIQKDGCRWMLKLDVAPWAGGPPAWMRRGDGVVNNEDNGLGGAFEAYNDGSRMGWMIAFHRAYVQREMRYFAEAFGARYRDNKNVYGVMICEMPTGDTPPSDWTWNKDFHSKIDDWVLYLAGRIPNTMVQVAQAWSTDRRNQLSQAVNVGFGCADCRCYAFGEMGPYDPDNPHVEATGYYAPAHEWNVACENPPGGKRQVTFMSQQYNGWYIASLPAGIADENNIYGLPAGMHVDKGFLRPQHYLAYLAGPPRNPGAVPHLNSVPGVLPTQWIVIAVRYFDQAKEPYKTYADWRAAFEDLGAQGLGSVPAEPYNWESQCGTRFAVAAGADDAEERLDSHAVSLASSDLELVRDGADQLVGLRFRNVAMPADAQIQWAFLEFTTDESSTEPTTLSLTGEATDNAAPLLAQTANLSARARTTASVGWSPSGWSTVGKLRKSPDITPVLHEILARPGWRSGNALAILIHGTGRRVAVSRDKSASAAPTLVVSFTVPALASPSNLTATALSESSIRLSWADRSANEERFELDRRESGTSDWVNVTTLPPDSTTHTDTGLPADTLHYYRVRATRSDRSPSDYSSLASARTLPVPPPAVPSDMKARAVASDRIELLWRDRSDNEALFKIDRRRSGTSGWVRIAALPSETTRHTDTGLPAATKFYYMVKAWNTSGNSAYAPTADARTPDGVQAQAAWRYRKGTAEVSAPGSAWRRAGFDDSAWAQGAGPFGYGDGPYGTELTDMRAGYTCLFLRRTFDVQEPAAVEELRLDLFYDDGFVVWINGQELGRQNLRGQPGTQNSFFETATDSVGDGTPWSLVLRGANLPVLSPGANVLAVQVFNVSLSDSSDFTAAAELSLAVGHWSLAEDPDQDGMPDAWESAYLSDLTDPTDRTDRGDPDGDGVSNLEEYIAGTSPVDET